MSTCICLDNDGKILLVVLQRDAISLGYERFELLEDSVFVVIQVFFSIIFLVKLFDVKHVE